MRVTFAPANGLRRARPRGGDRPPARRCTCRCGLIADGDGCEVTFSLRRSPGMTDADVRPRHRAGPRRPHPPQAGPREHPLLRSWRRLPGLRVGARIAAGADELPRADRVDGRRAGRPCSGTRARRAGRAVRAAGRRFGPGRAEAASPPRHPNAEYSTLRAARFRRVGADSPAALDYPLAAGGEALAYPRTVRSRAGTAHHWSGRSTIRASGPSRMTRASRSR